jgi:hypothetical protein
MNDDYSASPEDSIPDPDISREPVEWRALPPLDGGVYVGMVTEVLDENGIPNVVKTDLEAGGLGMVQGTSPLGNPWRIQVPVSYFDRAMEIYEAIVGGGEADANGEPTT